MKQAWWKRLLSYFIEISIEKSSSSFNPHLEIKLVEGRKQLQTADAIYSFDDKYENFYYSFRQFNWNILDVKKVLVLGLGLGSVMYILEKKMGKIFDYTAVEIDPEICRLAHHYTLNELESFVEVYNLDGLQFLQSNNQSFDLVIMDIFQSAVVPQIFQTPDFLTLLKSKLNSNGLLLFNRMNITKKDYEENEKFRNSFLRLFPKMVELKVKDNIVFINDKELLIKA